MSSITPLDSSDSGFDRPSNQTPQRHFAMIALGVFVMGMVGLSRYSWQQSALFLIGGLFGVTLYRSGFGFASAYRKLFIQREVTGIYAQLVMLGVATILFAPVLAAGSIGGQVVKGAVAPIGLQGIIGAVLFGVGMQFGGACGCGTLYTLGSGSLSMGVTFLAFSVGAFVASLTRSFWAGLPSIPPISLGMNFGWLGAVVLQLAVITLIAIFLRWSQYKGIFSGWRSLEIKSFFQFPGTRRSWLSDRWSLFVGAVLLAILNWFTLIISGQPWRVTWGFALGAAKVALFLGWNPNGYPVWGTGSGQQALGQPLFTDASIVINLGVILGALIAASAAGQFLIKTAWNLPAIASALGGGFAMGYGAFLAFGCNISAFFGGIASTSLHGWIWIIAALVGTAIGLWLRRKLGFEVN
ncbi:YeeE/YedE family protein [Alkalinema pantanalense CENA528]|uniref:YeeE/YedE family protein n=1 Tax=Alkalinema pantanalense TaxID=1620705 RepID=UPI003D701F24